VLLPTSLLEPHVTRLPMSPAAVYRAVDRIAGAMVQGQVQTPPAAAAWCRWCDGAVAGLRDLSVLPHGVSATPSMTLYRKRRVQHKRGKRRCGRGTATG